MKYSEIRGSLKSGDIVAYSHTRWGNWSDFIRHAIRFVTESEFSHVGMVYVEEGRVFVMEAVSSGVRIRPLSDSLPFYIISNPRELSAAAVGKAFSKLGTPYESKWKMLVNLFVNMKLSSNNRLQCCEYVNVILSANRQNLLAEDTPASVVEHAIQSWGPLNYVEGD